MNNTIIKSGIHYNVLFIGSLQYFIVISIVGINLPVIV